MRLVAIYRHPVKSLGSEPLSRVTLDAGVALPGDRAHAITHGDSAFDPDNPGWAACGNFLRITNVPALARPAVSYAPKTRILTLSEDGTQRTYELHDAADREALAAWAGAAAEGIRPGPYRVADAPGVSLTDAQDQAPSLMSLASLRDLSAQVGVTLDPRRFRGNLWIDGDDLAPWAELGWAGRVVTMGGAQLTITAPITRCLATAANPDTGQRDDNPVPALKALHGKPVFGMIAGVTQGGDVAVGDAVTLD